MTEKLEVTAALNVFIVGRETECSECRERLGRQAWVAPAGDNRNLCLDCADLAHLQFLPSGNIALTRRAKKNSTLSAVVLKWSGARKRYERQGLLVEQAALEKAEAQCLADAEVRQRRQAREALRREETDRHFVEAFAAKVRALYPACPIGREHEIAAHACLKYSGRVGRSASAKELADGAVHLAVAAHVRHAETGYDELLATGVLRREARTSVRDKVDALLAAWAAAP